MIPSPNQHPLPRDGTSQERRFPAALDPARRLLDDRDLDDLLDQLRGLSAFVKYYDSRNQARGTWEPFFDPHFAVRLATLAHRDHTALRARSAEAIQALEAGPAADRPPAAWRLFLLAADELKRIDRELESLHSTPFGAVFERALFSLVRPALLRLTAVIKAAAEPERERWLGVLRDRVQSGHWQLVLRDVAPAPDVTSAAEAAAALGRVLPLLAQQLISLGERVAEDAATQLESGELRDGRQPPHLGLLLAWLRLFRHAQEALNDLVRRHLEFYYGCRLRIPAKPAVPDRAFAVVEPARNASGFKLAKDTRLHAGKDARKTELRFALTRDLIVNRAAVADLRSLYRDAAQHGLVRSAEVANSIDGRGTALPKENPSWQPFGHAELDPGRWGFAVAAPVLRMSGGTKDITLSLEFSAGDATKFEQHLKGTGHLSGSMPADGWALDGLFAVSLTGPDGWWSPEATRVKLRFAAPRLLVKVSPIPVDQPISDYDVTKHGRRFQTTWPVLELTRLLDSFTKYETLPDLRPVRVKLECTVKGDTNLVAANDYGPLNPTKPFQPFGGSPAPNSSLYLGSTEIFSKHLTALTFRPEWKDLPDDLGNYFADYVTPAPASATPKVAMMIKSTSKPAPSGAQSTIKRVTASAEKAVDLTANLLTPRFRLRASYLHGGEWQPLNDGAGIDLGAGSWTLTSIELEQFQAAPQLGPLTAYDAGLVRGFARLQLVSPDFAFGHQKYPALVTAAVVAGVKEEDLVLPNPPISPTVVRLLADYTATEERNLGVEKGGAEAMALFHVEPHGEWELTGPLPSWLPATPADGIFYLGLAGTAGGDEVSLLFHVADGSGDPFENYPELAWEYLAADEWVGFPAANLVSDSTRSLRRTGVIVFGLPEDATTHHTRMPAGRVWIRATAVGKVVALNRAYSVVAQAVETVFVPADNNDLSRLSSALPAGSMTRLVTSRPEVKKVTQPLPSFGGRPGEQGPGYYRRVSERLRHRQRAVTLWDYERLVLEAFPELHMVKCVPHSRANPDSELAPGHLTVVLVPLLAANAFDPRRPAASQDLIAAVKSFLLPLTTAQIDEHHLHVVNPRYEEVRVEAKLALRRGFTDTGFYETAAAAELTAFLTPWVAGDQRALAFDAGLYPSTLLNFLEERPYVDFVRDFHVNQTAEFGLAVDPIQLTPSTERSILVSATSHALKVLPPEP